MRPKEMTLSDPRKLGPCGIPWLSVEIDHHFGDSRLGFHLFAKFDAHAPRTVIFGPSGSGKSSILRAIAGLLHPDTGRIEIQGRSVRESFADVDRHVPVEQRNVGLVMQTPAIFPHLTAAGNVAFALKAMEKSARAEKVTELLSIVRALPLAERWPRELSGGQLQRIAIARTLASTPSILLLDEPFSALDARSRQELSDNVHKWARDNAVPVLTVTHNLEEAFAAGDEVIAMRDGRIVAQGSPAEVLAEERRHLLTAMGAISPDNAPKTDHAPET